jgi:hypothetical protein
MVSLEMLLVKSARRVVVTGLEVGNVKRSKFILLTCTDDKKRRSFECSYPGEILHYGVSLAMMRASWRDGEPGAQEVCVDFDVAYLHRDERKSEKSKDATEEIDIVIHLSHIEMEG